VAPSGHPVWPTDATLRDRYDPGTPMVEFPHAQPSNSTAVLAEWGSSTALEAELTPRIIRAAALVASVTAVAFSGLYLITGPSEFIAPNLLAAVGLLALAAAGQLPSDVRMVLAATVANAVFTYQLLLVGRIDNGISVWFTVPAFAAMVLGLRKTTAYCAGTAAVVLLAIVLGRRAGVLAPQVVMPAADLVMAASTVGVLLLCTLFAYLTVRSRRQLYREVDAQHVALTAAFDEAQAAKAQALEAVAARDRFFANLTHEIRTPLTGIAGSAELIASGELNGEQQQLADGLLASTRSLTTLVNAMLDHARLAAGRTTPEVSPVDTTQLADELERLYRPVAADRGLGFRVTIGERVPATMETDGIRLRQVLANLIANALKFTERGRTSVTLDWEPAVGSSAGTFVAAVTDSGPGIAPELRDVVFEPFVQGDPTIRRAHGGTGLGLAISRQLAELLGGRIELSTTVGEGSTFTVRVPAVALSAPATEPAAPAPLSDRAGANGAEAAAPGSRPAVADGALNGLRVLLVEDNDVNRTVAAAMLRRAGLEVMVAISGGEAVELATSIDLDLVLMDLQMPGVDGIEATRRIRAIEVERSRPRVPIVAMTGNALADYGDACTEAGMDAFVTKPVTASQLRGVVAQALARA
jgi:signal transduction histidine kinase/CheY-like chemotaxis protein